MAGEIRAASSLSTFAQFIVTLRYLSLGCIMMFLVLTWEVRTRAFYKALLRAWAFQSIRGFASGTVDLFHSFSTAGLALLLKNKTNTACLAFRSFQQRKPLGTLVTHDIFETKLGQPGLSFWMGD